LAVNHKIHTSNHILESSKEISRIADSALRRAGAIGKLPTPIDEIVAASNISELDSFEELRNGFANSLKKGFRDIFTSAIQKVKGIADLRERAIYIPNSDNRSSIFPKAHDLGHQVIPWHNIHKGYLEDDLTLSRDIEDQFEQEASFFASEVIFQGKIFKRYVRNYKASMSAVLNLSAEFGATIQSTIWKYAEQQDEAIAVAMYYSDNKDDTNERLRLWKIIPSSKFLNKYSQLDIPLFLEHDHPWVAAKELKYTSPDEIFSGKDKLICGRTRYAFEWQSFWNTYTLFVSLRHIPVLSMLGSKK
jgi:Zn-dependent peptidase ImmA (M78 family)